MDLQNATVEELKSWEAALSQEFDDIKNKGLSFDLTRGKPASAQMDLASALDGILKSDYQANDGSDTRNYGNLEGIAEARALGAEILSVPVSQVMAAGNSSLTLMYQTMSIAFFFGLNGSESAWNTQTEHGPIKCICPVPGYDRHYGVCQHLGIEMVTVPMDENGPDMDAVETLIKSDPSIRAMWCVPKYSNPTGVIYSDAVVDRIAQLGKIAHKDFRVFWDNAYGVHDLVDNPKTLKNIYQACDEAGTADSVLHFGSTSKITFAGSGVAFLAASDNNLAGLKQSLRYMTIGPDKINQLRHAKFFAAPGSLKAHMQKHAAIIKPKFESVLAKLNGAFKDTNMGCWETPEGGYFISFNTQSGLAKTVVSMASDAGVKLTPAGATFPYGNDPEDSNIRIAPTVPPAEQVDQAMDVFVLCVKLASVRKALQARD